MRNPADEELDRSFAANVCGWHLGDGEGEFTGYWYSPDRTVAHLGRTPPRFTQSADLVLPWLEKRYIETEIKSWWDSPAQHFNESTRQGHRVFEPNGVWTVRVPGNNTMAEDKSFARAAVIALLRANGIEVEFSHAN